jgi:REP element-mobilizing transposase RayT
MRLDINKPFPKRPRLKDFNYSGTYAYFVTILTKDHTAYFKEAEVIDSLIDILIETARSERFDVIAYCFMPDYFHLVVIGKDDKSNLKKFISLFKQKSGYWFKKNYNENLWHISYYDHILRKEESIENVALYILENPVRKGVVSDFREYPFSRLFL